MSSTAGNNSTLIAAPLTPIRPGYTFAGWYKETSCITPWDFVSDRETTSKKLYAKWILNPQKPSTITVAPSGINSVKLTWSAVTGVSGYEVYRTTSDEMEPILLTTTTLTSYTNVKLGDETTYNYRVRAFKLESSIKAYSEPVSIVYVKI